MADDWDQGGLADNRPLADEGEEGVNDPTWIITQEAISEYLRLWEEHNEFECLKAQLQAALEGGAEVEPGPWRLELEVRERRALTAAGLIAALGLSDEQVRRLKAAAPARALRRLVVLPDFGGR